jgi:3-hydroxyacyl-[acyl-carrier-protein] dehydratase
MRWFWIDRFTSFVGGREATAIKNVALDEEALDDYCLGFPYLPSPLIIEGFAQLGGVLVAETSQFAERVVLAKVSRATFHQPARPGDQLHYHARLDSLQHDGAMVSCSSRLNDAPQAEAQLMFAFLSAERFGDRLLFAPDQLCTMLRLMGFYSVAVDAAGNPLTTGLTTEA